MSLKYTEKTKNIEGSLWEAVRFYRGVSKMAEALGVHHSTISKILNDPYHRHLNVFNTLKIERDMCQKFYLFAPFRREQIDLIVNRNDWLVRKLML